MAIIVVDASVAAKFVLTEAETGMALELLHGTTRMAAPAIIKYEVTGAVLRRLRQGGIEAEPARTACENWHTILHESAIHLIPTDDLYEQAVELAFKIRHALADCLYLAAAQRLDAPLLTADPTFCERAAKVYGSVEMLAKAA